MTQRYGHPDTKDTLQMAHYYLGDLYFKASIEDDEKKLEEIKTFLRSRQTWRNEQ